MDNLIHHPVHILDENGQISPSSFIPFCEIGGDSSKMGAKILNFSVNVCKSFKPKVLNDRLCYQINPNDFEMNSELELRMGLIFFLDYNEDRHKHKGITERKTLVKNFYESFEHRKESDEALIYLSTIGNSKMIKSLHSQGEVQIFSC